jgi:predicted extracellular nuclease
MNSSSLSSRLQAHALSLPFEKKSGLTMRPLMIAALLAAFSGSAMAASDVVISQVYGGGGNTGAVYKNDFIELFNRSGAPVNLNGWSVQYGGATGTSWAVTTLPNVILQPGQYFLVQEAVGTGGTTNLPTADKIGTLAMSSTAGKVLLANVATAVTSPTAASVLDLVGFGATANAFEGSAATPAPSGTNSVLRAGEGCTDTDQNGTDFIAGLAAPRNTASPLHACGVAGNAPILVTCPASLTLSSTTGGSAALSATDADGFVNSAVLASGTAAGFSLGSLTAATSAGGIASVSLNVDPSVANGSYPVVINFGNNQAQVASCTINVTIQPAAAVTHTIPQIQGSGSVSPFAGTTQTTEGVVTLKVNTGFYLQDPQGDGDPATSDGIYVFTGAAGASVSVGDRVRVSGTVTEFAAGDAARTITELGSVTGITTINTGNVIAPTNIALPLAAPNDLERYEGMLVHFTTPLTVSQNYFLGRYGQVTLSSGRLEKATNRYRAGSPEAIAATAANAANVIVLDDGSSLQNPNPIPFIGVDNTLRAGDTVADLTGVIDFGLISSSNPGPSGYKLQPSITPVFARDNPRTAAPAVVGGNVKVSSFNVLNFFTTFTDGTTAGGLTGQGCTLGTSSSKSNCRGANNLAEFTRQRAKIVAAMKAINADALGLMELQNIGDVAVSSLVDGLNAELGAGTYAFVPQPTGANSTGDDAIRVGMIYKPAKLTLVGGSLSDTDAINNRPPLAQTFQLANGKRFSLIVNHMKSKSSCPLDGSLDDDQGDGQGCWNARRLLQAQRLANVFIPQVQAAANDTDVLVIGDLNSYGAEDPIRSLIGSGMVSEIERFIRPSGAPYSFVFDGESGYIDHGLATASLDASVTGVTEWHINSDEPSVIDYNTEFKPQDLYTASPYRASDHDPVIIGLNLQPKFADVTASIGTFSSGLVLNRATQNFTGTLTITNTGSSTLAGPFQVELDNLTAGVTLVNASGTHLGAPYLTAANTTLAPGQSISIAVSFKNPAKVNLSYSATIYSGNF